MPHPIHDKGGPGIPAFRLTAGAPFGTLSGGEVSERFKVLLSKSSVVHSHRGFESHPLRHHGQPPNALEGSHSLA